MVPALIYCMFLTNYVPNIQQSKGSSWLRGILTHMVSQYICQDTMCRIFPASFEKGEKRY